MALPPTVPTSFVPKQPVQTTRRAARGGGSSIFMIISLVVVALALAGAAGAFGYDYYLKSVRDDKAAELAEAEASISRATIDEFLRLNNRLNAAGTLLDQHVALSQYLDVLESLTLQTVSFDGLTVEIGPERVATISMEGSARSFNALAAQSSAFAAEKRIKRAIFSDINVGETGLVQFSLTAELDPALIKWDGVTPMMPAPETATTAPIL